jgi:prepilin-type N-terminal cleavage/methylation domain-containing protein
MSARCRHPSPPTPLPASRGEGRRRRGFTLLEVVIALAILAVSLVVLVESQSSAVLITMDAQKTLTGTWLAEEKLTEALLRVEYEGFSEDDIDEEGDFSDFGANEEFGADVDFGDDFEDYKWAYTIREVNLEIGDLGGIQDQLTEAGYGPSEEEQEAAGTSTGETKDLSDAGIEPDMITDMLKPYIREVRVLVWWGDKEPDLEEGCEDCIELVSHIINSSGQIAGLQ